jgi:DNA-directed RNA polymerase subunit RPC12/RpoP
MKVSCPACKFAGNIRDNLVPEEGKNIGCPRCKTRLFVKRPSVSVVADTRGEEESPKIELVSYDRAMLDDVMVKPAIKDTRARCENCGKEIVVPENRKIVLCPHCGSNIIRQAIPDGKDFGLMRAIKKDASETAEDMYRRLKGYLRGRRGRKTLGIILFVVVLFLLMYSVKINNVSPESENLLDKSIDISINIPRSDGETSSDTERGGILKDLITIDITSRDEVPNDEPKIRQITFKDGSKSDYFRYYRYDKGLIYITLPASGGGFYELGYSDFDVKEIKRVRNVPDGVKVYGIN